MNEIRFIDLFSGIGGFRLGLQRANDTPNQSERGNQDNEQGKRNTLQVPKFRCVWSNDFNKYANQVYTKQFGEEEHYSGNIRGVSTEEIPNFDLLCAGFPCQAFSVAGKRKGFQDTRGTLFFEICRIAEAKRPSLLLLENVKGLLSHDRGRTFTIILQSLDELGYWLEWQVLNSKYFGVPQNRERVFIIGHLRGGSTRPLFPINEVHQNYSERTRKEPWGQIGATLSGKSAGGQNARGNYVLTPREISTALDANYWKGPDRHDARTIIVDYLNRSVRKDEIFNTLKTSQGSPSSSPSILADRTRTLAGKGRSLESPKEITNALSSVQKDNLLLKNMDLRRLTPIECERLQGFPDRWTEGVSDTQRYRLLGNAVTVNVIEFLGGLIKSLFTNDSSIKEGS